MDFVFKMMDFAGAVLPGFPQPPHGRECRGRPVEPGASG